MLKIDKRIVAPPRGRSGRPAIYPFRDMGVGDSFFAPLPKGRNPRNLQVSIAVSGRSVLGKGSVITKIVTEKGAEGVRAWRIK